MNASPITRTPARPPLPASRPVPTFPQEPVSAPATERSHRMKAPPPKLTADQAAIVEASEREKAGRLATALAADPLVTVGLAGWAHRKPAERLAVLERIAKIQGQVYAFTPAPMSVKWMADPDTDGDYDDDTRQITLNRTLVAKANPEEAVDAVIHEQLHAYQHQKYVDLQNGRLPAGDHPVTLQARQWQWNDKHYHDHNDKAYRANAVEAHAFKWTEVVMPRLRPLWGK